MLPKNPALQLSKKRRAGLKEVFIDELKHYFEEANLHGFRFVVLKKSTVLERSIWGAIIVTAIISVSVLLHIAYTSFMSDPTVVFTESTHNMVWNYPFPAVTICNFNQISKSSLLDFVKTLKTNYSEEVLLRKMKILFQLISITNTSIRRNEVESMHALLEENGVKADELLGKLAPKCEDIADKCKWKGEEKGCNALFRPQKTTSGFCCSFNYYGTAKRGNNTKEARLSKELRTPSTPRRLSACGFRTALEVLIQSEPEDYFATQIPSIGHLLLIHPPYSFPQFIVSGSFTLAKNSFNFFSVQPSSTYAANIRSLTIEERKCVFSDEIRLHNFEKYTYQNCLVECRMNITRELCGCVPFYYYNPDGTYPQTRICNLKDILCLRDNYYLLWSSKPGFTFHKQNRTEKRFKCKCYQDCEDISYTIEVSTSKVSRKYSTNHLDLYAGSTVENSTVVRVFYTDLFGAKNRNDVKYDFDALIALYGGLLSLFLGFSVVSIYEVVYFLVIRTVAQSLKRKRSGNKIKVQQVRKGDKY